MFNFIFKLFFCQIINKTNFLKTQTSTSITAQPNVTNERNIQFKIYYDNLQQLIRLREKFHRKYKILKVAFIYSRLKIQENVS